MSQQVAKLVIDGKLLVEQEIRILMSFDICSPEPTVLSHLLGKDFDLQIKIIHNCSARTVYCTLYTLYLLFPWSWIIPEHNISPIHREWVYMSSANVQPSLKSVTPPHERAERANKSDIEISSAIRSSGWSRASLNSFSTKSFELGSWIYQTRQLCPRLTRSS